MASLKEIRGRINSVTNTRKITSAMKMVSSAKLHRAQDAVIRFYPYCQKISGIMNSYLSSGGSLDTQPLAQPRAEVKKVAIIAFSSNTSLCGAFNAGVIKKINEVLCDYKHLPRENVTLYLFGKKIYDGLLANTIGTIVQGPNIELVNKPNYAEANTITEQLMARFLANDVDKVELIFNKYKSTAVHHITRETLLPIGVKTTSTENNYIDYIIEPNPQQLLQALVPTVIHLQFYGALLNSYASEHGARTTAMQIATDNADELIEGLMLQYNKVRQGTITKEILDIIGGAEAIR